MSKMLTTISKVEDSNIHSEQIEKKSDLENERKITNYESLYDEDLPPI